MRPPLRLLTATLTAISLSCAFAPDGLARFFSRSAKKKSSEAANCKQSGSRAVPKNGSRNEVGPSRSAESFKHGSGLTGADSHVPAAGDDASANPNAPVVVPPSTLDVTTAKFGKLAIDLKDAAFLEAKVGHLHLGADRLDMAAGTLYSLDLKLSEGEFQDFTIDSMEMSSQGNLHFDIAELLNNKVLQFVEPANAEVRVFVSQGSLNRFLNSAEVLARLSGSAKKRVPILSTLARQDVNFGFTFTGGNLELKPDNHVRIAMDSKLGVGKAGLPMQLVADTKLELEKGWVNLTETHLLTAGQNVPQDMASKIVNRINDLSKWGTVSDDIQFQFTSLAVVPGERLELAGTAIIKRIGFQRASSTTNENHKPSVPANPESPNEVRLPHPESKGESPTLPNSAPEPKGETTGAGHIVEPSGAPGETKGMSTDAGLAPRFQGNQ